MYTIPLPWHRENRYSKKTKKQVKQIAVDGAKLIERSWQKRQMATLHSEYSPESFPGTEVDYALDVCNAVLDDTGSPQLTDESNHQPAYNSGKCYASCIRKSGRVF